MEVSVETPPCALLVFPSVPRHLPCVDEGDTIDTTTIHTNSDATKDDPLAPCPQHPHAKVLPPQDTFNMGPSAPPLPSRLSSLLFGALDESGASGVWRSGESFPPATATPLYPSLLSDSTPPPIHEEPLISMASAQAAKERGDLNEAVRLLQQLREEKGRHNNMEVATVLWELGGLLRHQNKLPEAEEALRAALQARQFVQGWGGALTAQAARALAQILMEQRRAGEAMEILRLSIQGLESAGSNKGECAACLHTLGRALQAQGKHTDAEIEYRRCLAIRKELFGNQHNDVATTLSSLGSTLLSQGRAEEAEQLYRETLKQKRHFLGETNTEVATCLSNIASSLLSQGRVDEALPLHAQCVAICEKILPRDHPTSVTGHFFYGQCLIRAGKYAMAEKTFRRVMESQRRIHGGRSAKVATTIAALATTLQGQHMMEDAQSFLLQAIEMTRETLGEANPQMSSQLHSLGLLYHQMGRVRDAVKVLRRALTLGKSASPAASDRDVASIMASLAQCLRSKKRKKRRDREIETLLRDVIAIRRASNGDSHPDLCKAMENLGTFLTERERLEEGNRLLSEALEMKTNLYGVHHPQAAVSLLNMASNLTRRKRPSEARILLQKATTILTRAYGDENALTQTALNSFGYALKAAGEWCDAMRLFQRVLHARRVALDPQHPLVMDQERLVHRMRKRMNRVEKRRAKRIT